VLADETDITEIAASADDFDLALAAEVISDRALAVWARRKAKRD
jgi:hypothetical protein